MGCSLSARRDKLVFLQSPDGERGAGRGGGPIIDWINERNKVTCVLMRPNFKQADCCPRRLAALITIGVFLVLLASTFLFFIQQSVLPVVTTSPSATHVAVRGYFRNGQWRADALTLVAAARWCFEPSSAIPSTAASSNLPPTLATNTPPVTRT